MNDLVLTLRDISNQFEDYDLVYKIRNTNLARKWADHFKTNFIDNDHPIEKNYCLQGWQTSWETNYPRSLNHICSKLNYHIQIINEEMPKYGYPFIDLHFSVEALKNDPQQELLNKIHHHFELLIGQQWDPSDWWLLNLHFRTRFSIRMLNNYCHEIESILRSIKNKSLGIFGSLNGIDPGGRHFDTKKSSELTLTEYKEFSDSRPFGSIHLYYAQLGKSHFEVYCDNDTDIERKNISGIRNVTGEFVIQFQEKGNPLDNQSYVNWLKDNNWNIKDPRLALTCGIVADLTNKEDHNTIVEEILKRNDLYKISLNGQTKTYNYTWIDQENWEKDLQ